MVVLKSRWEYRRASRNALLTPERRADLLHGWCRRGLDAIAIRLTLEGTPPRSGMLVSNHLSYLDILVFSAALPCAFVSKEEVRRWPVFGRFAEYSGTVFVRRNKTGDAYRANETIIDYLNRGVAVVLFPEGTTTDGSHVLRFHSTMLHPAINTGAWVTPCAIRYELSDGDPAEEICWWGDMAILPHLFNLIGKRVIRAIISFGAPVPAAGDRKALSEILHDQVAALHSGQVAVPVGNAL